MLYLPAVLLSILYVKLDYLSNVKNRPVLAYRTVQHISEDILLFAKYIVSSSGTARKRNIRSPLAVIFVP